MPGQRVFKNWVLCSKEVVFMVNMNIERYIRRIIRKIPLLNKLVIQLSMWGLKDTAKTGEGSDLCLSKGFLPVPIHFYSPIPDLCPLNNQWVSLSIAKIWPRKKGPSIV